MTMVSMRISCLGKSTGEDQHGKRRSPASDDCASQSMRRPSLNFCLQPEVHAPVFRLLVVLNAQAKQAPQASNNLNVLACHDDAVLLKVEEQQFLVRRYWPLVGGNQLLSRIAQLAHGLHRLEARNASGLGLGV